MWINDLSAIRHFNPVIPDRIASASLQHQIPTPQRQKRHPNPDDAVDVPLSRCPALRPGQVGFAALTTTLLGVAGFTRRQA